MAAIFYTLASLKARFEDQERGATAVEYALVIALVSIVFVVALSALNVGGLVTYINGFLTGAAGGGAGT